MTPRKSSEPACRVCGCTEHNACEQGCSWVPVEKNSPPLCSACSGTAGDMAESLKRSLRLLGGTGIRERIIEVSFAIGRAALRRRMARVKSEAKNPDPAWGNR